MTLKSNLVDIEKREIYPAEVRTENGRIASVRRIDEACETYILPGFVDAHIHVESSMLVPTEFARLAVAHGTVATVSDPHEIANVLGIAGVEYMLETPEKRRSNSRSARRPACRRRRLRPAGRRWMSRRWRNCCSVTTSITSAK